MGHPQFLVWYACHALFPTQPVSQLSRPILAYVLLVKMAQQGRDPGRRMDSIGNMANRNLFQFPFGPEPLPERTRNLFMLEADSVCRSTHSNRQRSQTKSLILV